MPKARFKTPKKEWTPDNILSRVKSELRRRWMWHWKPRREALATCKVRGASLWICSDCKKLSKYVEADHIEAVVQKGDCCRWYWIERLFHSSPQAIRPLCPSCHDKKHSINRAQPSL